MQFATDEEYQNYRRDLEQRRNDVLQKIDEAAADLLRGTISQKEALAVRLAADRVLEEYYRFALRYCQDNGKLRTRDGTIAAIRRGSQ